MTEIPWKLVLLSLLALSISLLGIIPVLGLLLILGYWGCFLLGIAASFMFMALFSVGETGHETYISVTVFAVASFAASIIGFLLWLISPSYWHLEVLTLLVALLGAVLKYFEYKFVNLSDTTKRPR